MTEPGQGSGRVRVREVVLAQHQLAPDQVADRHQHPLPCLTGELGHRLADQPGATSRVAARLGAVGADRCHGQHRSRVLEPFRGRHRPLHEGLPAPCVGQPTPGERPDQGGEQVRRRPLERVGGCDHRPLREQVGLALGVVVAGHHLERDPLVVGQEVDRHSIDEVAPRGSRGVLTGQERVGQRLPQRRAGDGLRVVEGAEALHDPRPEHRLLVGSADARRRWERRHGGGKGSACVAGLVPVLRDRERRRVRGQETGVGLQHLRPPPVPRPPRARPQLAVRGLAEQGVAERHRVRRVVGDEDAGPDRLRERAVELVGCRVDDLLEESEAEVSLAHGRRLDESPRLRGEPGQATRSNPRCRHDLGPPASRGQLLHHERHAVTQLLDPRGHARWEARPHQGEELGANLVGGQPPEPHDGRPGNPRQPGDVRREGGLVGRGALRVLRAHGRHQQESSPQRPHREVDHVAGGRVGPVQVLDQPDDEAIGAQPLEQVAEGREDLHALDVTGRDQPGQQGCQGLALDRGQHVGPVTVHEVPEGVREDAERDLAGGHVGAVAGDDQCVVEPVERLADEPALADACLADDEQASRITRPGAHDRLADGRDVLVPADEPCGCHHRIVACRGLRRDGPEHDCPVLLTAR